MNRIFVLCSALLALAACAPAPDTARQVTRDLDGDLGPGVFRDCAVCPEMKFLPPGSYTKGSPASLVNELDWERHISGVRILWESPQVDITIEKPFAIARFEVTRDQFAEFVKATGHETQPHCVVWAGDWDTGENGKSWRDPGIPQASDHPAVCVSKNDARAYAAWLSEITGRTYRLPTEAEWEYASRAGSTTVYPWGDDGSEVCRYGNIADATMGGAFPARAHQTCNDTWLYTSPAGMFEPNAWGLYDMIGNAWEWVADCWMPNHSAMPGDGAAVSTGFCDESPLRGGAYGTGPLFTRSATRGGPDPEDMRQSWIGFRVAAEAE